MGKGTVDETKNGRKKAESQSHVQEVDEVGSSWRTDVIS